ncbi:MAG TPA: type I-C CRISPR-associated protein Cas5c [bacterium]|nr:type I-C CRISPR-associated protein Cas5c [bacterium]
MAYHSPPYRVRIRGDLACFTRPEFKTERVSYEVMTPSAARGVLEAILWKPAICWHIDRIEVLAPIRFTGFRRNEVEGRVSVANVKTAMKSGKLPDFVVETQRQQRHTLALEHVDYVVTAHFTMTDKAGPDDNPTKFEEMFRRRLAKGQCFHQPYLGCREFPARVTPADDVPPPIDLTKSLGLMLYDIEFDALNRGDRLRPLFFRAEMQQGVVAVPPREQVVTVGGAP